MLLELLKEALPKDVNFLRNYYEVKKILRDLRHDYKKIDACSQNYMLCTKLNANTDKCSICGTSRCKNVKHNSTDCLRNVQRVRKFLLRFCGTFL